MYSTSISAISAAVAEALRPRHRDAPMRPGRKSLYSAWKNIQSRGVKFYGTNGGGLRERERRMRQIECGQLKRENGLDIELSQRLKAEGRI